MKQKIIILKGLPASGKTTFAKEFCEKNIDYIRVNRDDLRNMCGKYWVPQREDYITQLERFSVETALEEGYNIILDATNFNPKIKIWVDELCLAYICESEERVFSTDVEECIRRDSMRENPVSESVIRGMFNRYFKN